MKKTKSNILAFVVFTLVLSGSFLLSESCRSPFSGDTEENTYTNPIFRYYNRPSVTSHKGNYYFLHVANQSVYLIESKDPSSFRMADRHLICEVNNKYGFYHIWQPQLVFIDEICYVYFSADDGNTDNHRLYVLSNNGSNPMEGDFEMLGLISTDEDNNWAIHSNVFNYGGVWYMVWSGWEKPREYVETQCIYIARMENPWTLATERVKLSEPVQEWERQWMEPDGNSPTSYPVYVNEAPFFFCNEKTDKAYIYYSASATWTPYYAQGQLSADKNSDLLDPASWHKESLPVFHSRKDAGIFSTGSICIIPSPDSTEYFLVYAARPEELRTLFPSKNIYMHRIEFDNDGKPDLGIPLDPSVRLRKPSGFRASDKSMNNNRKQHLPMN